MCNRWRRARGAMSRQEGARVIVLEALERG